MPSLRVLPDLVWLHRFAAGGAADLSMLGGTWWSVTCAENEMSVVCEHSELPHLRVSHTIRIARDDLVVFLAGRRKR